MEVRARTGFGDILIRRAVPTDADVPVDADGDLDPADATGAAGQGPAGPVVSAGAGSPTDDRCRGMFSSMIRPTVELMYLERPRAPRADPDDDGSPPRPCRRRDGGREAGEGA